MLKTVQTSFFFLLISFFWACESEKVVEGAKIKINDSTEYVVPAKPEKLIPKNQMVSLLVQMQISEVVVNHQALMQDKGLARFRKYESKILAEHQIDTATFRQNCEYYLNDIRRAESIYAAMMDSLLIRKDKKNF